MGMGSLSSADGQACVCKLGCPLLQLLRDFLVRVFMELMNDTGHNRRVASSISDLYPRMRTASHGGF